MLRNWTFGQKLASGFALTVLLTIAISVLAVGALWSVVKSKDLVIDVHVRQLVDAERLQTLGAERSGSFRAYLLTNDERFISGINDTRARYVAIIGELKKSSGAEATLQDMVSSIERLEALYKERVDQLIAIARSDLPVAEIYRRFDQDVLPVAGQLQDQVEIFRHAIQERHEEAKQASTEIASAAIAAMVVIALAVVLVAAVVASALTRTLKNQLNTAVSQVQSSSTQLQSAANQQASGAKEQAAATKQVTTTITELLATSRQISDSAGRVADIAQQTVAAARSGEITVEKGQAAITGIRRQVDLIVSHMLDLGKKSQQIGTILDIVFELAEQTNILAINATIEAAGAGESGKRFAIVAEEIRKLADRVAGSAKEIRTLIEDVRSAVNNTVMTTEGGSKAVDAGAAQFAEVATAFKQIAAHVATTTEAAKEIELSTKQQTSAVEQVNLAIANVAQAARETEASSAQTLQTASQLTGLSRDILRLVRPEAA